jgi:hypothetical protein
MLEHYASSLMRNWLDAEDANNNSMMKIGDLAVFLACIDDHLALAVFEVTQFNLYDKGGVGIGAIKYSDLTAPNSKVTVLGQVCCLTPSSSVTNRWETTHKFIPMNETTQSPANKKLQSIVEVPLNLIHLLSPNVIVNNNGNASEQLRWLLHENQLTQKMETAGDLMKLDNIYSIYTYESLCSILATEFFPYQDANGTSTDY